MRKLISKSRLHKLSGYMWKVFLSLRKWVWLFFCLEIKWQEVLHFHIFMVCYRVFQMDWGHFKELLILYIWFPFITFMVKKCVCTFWYWKCSSLKNVPKSILNTLYNIYIVHIFSASSILEFICLQTVVEWNMLHTIPTTNKKIAITITLILKKMGK